MRYRAWGKRLGPQPQGEESSVEDGEHDRTSSPHKDPEV
jgi:hypothetical protein